MIDVRSMCFKLLFRENANLACKQRKALYMSSKVTLRLTVLACCSAVVEMQNILPNYYRYSPLLETKTNEKKT